MKYNRKAVIRWNKEHQWTNARIPDRKEPFEVIYKDPVGRPVPSGYQCPYCKAIYNEYDDALLCCQE